MVFYFVLWCFVVFYDALWCFMVFCGVLWCFMGCFVGFVGFCSIALLSDMRSAWRLNQTVLLVSKPKGRPRV